MKKQNKKNNRFFIFGVLPFCFIVLSFLTIIFTAQKAQSRLVEACHIYNNSNSDANNWYFVDLYSSYFSGDAAISTCASIGVTDVTDCRNLTSNCLAHNGGSTFISSECRTMAENLRCNVGTDTSNPIGARSTPCIRETCSNSNCVAAGPDTTTPACLNSNKCGDSTIAESETCEFRIISGAQQNFSASTLLPPGTCRAPGSTAACSFCGDGVINTGVGEECDDGNLNGTRDHCSSSCSNTRCGDGIVNQSSEECDAGTANGGSECSATCTRPIITPNPRCGDGEVNQTTETCDLTNRRSPTLSFLTPEACRSGATDACSYCGDGIKQGSEICDPSAPDASNGCQPGQTCSSCSECITPPPTCGNGVRDSGEACDFRASPTGCGAGFECSEACACKPLPTPRPVCGNNILEGSEECEPANTGTCDASCRNIVTPPTPPTPPTPDPAIVTPDLRIQGSGGCSLRR